MNNLETLQQSRFFEETAKRWQQVTGNPLFLLSKEGRLFSTNNSALAARGQEIVKQVSPHEATFLNDCQCVTAPLIQEGQLIGYLVSPNAQKQQASLLSWGAENFLARVAELQAMQEMTDELINAWDQLELIYRVTDNLAFTEDLPEVLRVILEEIQKVTRTTDGFVLLRLSNDLLCVTCHPNNQKKLCDETLLDNVFRGNRVVVCNNAVTCRQTWAEVPNFIENLLATPVTIVDEDVQAVIGLINKSDNIFTAGDAKLLAALAQQVAAIIKNYITHERLIIEQRLSRELEIAAEIQESLLPTNLPHMGGVAMAVSSMPASEVGGDFYDFITIDDQHLTVVIGDVSGKGVPAAMLTSVTRTMLRVEALRGEPPHKIIKQANSVLYQDLSRADAFVTVFVATIDTAEGTLTYASAGHTPALIWRTETRKVDQLKATMLPIGIFNAQEEHSATVTLNPGDTLVFYTDGITEAQSPNDDFFGLERLVYIVKSRGGEAPEQLQQHIQSEVINFRRDASGRDDATLLILKTLPQTQTQTPQHISTVVKTVDFLYPAEMDYLSDISREITNTCRDLSALPPGPGGRDFLCFIELAISEICTNIIKHAYANCSGNISGQVTLLNNGIQLDFYDQGEGFDPNSVPEPKSDLENLTEGGYGLHIVRQIMDVVSYESHPDDGNHWHLIKLLPPGKL